VGIVECAMRANHQGAPSSRSGLAGGTTRLPAVSNGGRSAIQQQTSHRHEEDEPNMRTRNTVIAVTGLALALASCASPDAGTPPAASPPIAKTLSESSPPPATPAEVPVSKLAPNLELPAGSAEDDPTRFPELELWRVPTSYDSTVSHLHSQLPGNQDFDGLVWCAVDVNPKLNITQWSWGDAKDLLVIVANDDGTVTITRGPEEGDDRADCDVPAPGNAPHSELAQMPLPVGTVRSELFDQSPTMESWGFPGTHQSAVQYLREHLPIGRDYMGLRWCIEDGDGEYADWTWGGKADLLTVHVLGSMVTITREPNSYGCIE
jgi:hypothetical protein